MIQMNRDLAKAAREISVVAVPAAFLFGAPFVAGALTFVLVSKSLNWAAKSVKK